MIRKLRHDFDNCLGTDSGLLNLAKILYPLFGEKTIKSAFEGYDKRTRKNIDHGIIKTVAQTGILSTVGNIKNKEHNFYAE